MSSCRGQGIASRIEEMLVEPKTAVDLIGDSTLQGAESFGSAGAGVEAAQIVVAAAARTPELGDSDPI